MNIFLTSKSPKRCARDLDDKRLNKMILETAQLLCTAINTIEGEQVTPYRSSHVNHPITKWALENRSKGSLCFLYELGVAYGNEILYRRDRKHACHLVIEGLSLNWPWLLDIPKFMYDLEFHNGARHKGLGLDFTHLPVREAYREYLKARWPGDKRKPKWTRRKKPAWL